MGVGAKVTIFECGLELAPGIKTAALILPKYIKHLLNTR
jgi:hypothetical protein